MPEAENSYFDLPPFPKTVNENNKFLNKEIQLRKSAPVNRIISNVPIHPKK